MNRQKAWTAKEIEFLKSNYKTKTVVNIAKELNRSRSSVYGKIALMRKNRELAEFEKGEKTALELAAGRKTEEAYEKAIARPKPEIGLDLSKETYKKGKTYKVERHSRGVGSGSIGDYTVIKGKLIYETYRHITLENKHRTESFLKVDFLLGELGIEEVI